MSRLVRIGKNMVEISGLHGIWVGPDHLCRSKMTLFYLNRPTETITYEFDKHTECSPEKQFFRHRSKRRAEHCDCSDSAEYAPSSLL